MSGKNGILALVRASKKSTTLHTPVNVGVSNSDAWPTKEHESLKEALKKDKFFTALMLILQMNQIREIGSVLSSVEARDRPDFIIQYDNAQTYKIDGTVANKGSLHKLGVRIKKLKTLVVQHVRDCMLELNLISSRHKTMFTSDRDNSGAVSQDALLREDMQLHTVINDLLAGNLLEPGPNETAKIVRIIKKENNLKNVALKPGDKITILDETIQYQKSIAKMRELFTYYLLYAFGILCRTETVDQLKVQQQQHFLSAAYKAADDKKKPIFTAQIAIDYLTKECYTTNERTVTALRSKMARIVRYNNESLFTFLNRFPPLVNELEAAMGTTHSESEIIALWKLNFVKHMNKNEKHSIKIDHADYLTTTEWESIKNFSEGDFEFISMNKLLTQICVGLPKWKPSGEVRSWNDQRKDELEWDHEIDYRAPASFKKDGDQERRQDKSEHYDSKNGSHRDRSGKPRENKKRKFGDHKRDTSRGDRSRGPSSNSKGPRHIRSKDSKFNRGSKPPYGRSLLNNNANKNPRIPYDKQCQETKCIEKGVQATHEWAKCTRRVKKPYDKSGKNKPTNTGTPNKFQKPFNKLGQKSYGLNRNKDSSKFKKNPFKSGTSTSERKCWNCGDPGHLSPNCPRQAKINNLLQDSEEFTCLLAQQFDSEELWDCSQRMINTYGKTVCWKCCRPSCDANCTVESDPLSAYMPEAHEIMGQNPDLGTSISSAISQVDKTEKGGHYMAPLDHEMFYQSQEGQEDHHHGEDDPMELNINPEFGKSDSENDSRSESEKSYKGKSSEEDFRNSDTESDNEREISYDSDEEDT